MADSDSCVSEILSLLKTNPRGFSVSEVADALHINRNTTARYLDKLLVSGRVEMRSFGKAKVFFPAKRVPVSAMLNLSSELVLVADSRLTLIQANSQALSYLSCTADDIIGKPIYEGYGQKLCSGEMVGKLRTALHGTSDRDELRLGSGDAQVIFDVRMYPLVLPDGNKGVTLLLEDITSRVRAEEDVAKSNEQFRLILATVRDVLWSVNGEGIVTYMSPGVVRTAGYAPEELIGKPLVCLLSDADAARFSAVMMSASSRAAGFSLHEVQIVGKDGSVHYGDFTASPLCSVGSGQEFVGYSGALHDVTGRHEAEIGEKRWRLFLNGVLENIPAMVTASDLIDGTYYYANREAEMFLRRSRNELMNMTILEVLDEIRASKMREGLFSAVFLREKVTVHDTVVVGRRDINVSASFVPMRLSADREYIIAIVYPDV